MIRLLHVIPTLVRGGAEKQLCLLATRLPKTHFDVRVCVLTHTGPYERWLRQEGIPIDRINKRWKVDPWALMRLRQVMRRFQPDVVHSWIYAANVYGRVAALLESVPTIVAGQRCADHWKMTHDHLLDRWLATKSQRIVVNSQSVRDYYVRKQRVDPAKYRVIHNGIDTESGAGKTSGAARGALAESIGIPSDAHWIGVVARLWPQKRLKDAIWAADLLKVAECNFRVLFFGDGPQRWRLGRYARQVNAADRVCFLGDREDVARWLPHLRCSWLTSQYEGQSNAVMEAMAAGIPVVASDLSANRTLITHEQNGLLFPLGDRGDLARQTYRLLQDEELAARLGHAARETMARDFSADQMVDQYARLYQELVDETIRP